MLEPLSKQSKKGNKELPGSRKRRIEIPPKPHGRGQRGRAPKQQIMGREVVVAIIKGRLDFGPWEQIIYGEFDGRRRKRALVKIIGE